MPATDYRHDPKAIRKVMCLAKKGKSCREVAKATGIGRTTVGKIAADHGHVWGAKNIENAAKANRAYGAEWRAEFAEKLSAKCEVLLDDVDGEYLVHNFGGKDNTFAQATLKRPPHAERLKLIQAIRISCQTVLDIDRHDNVGADTSAVDAWLEAMKANPI